MQNNKPFFSILTPVYNRADFIVRTLDSIRMQLDVDYEVIIVDDCSEDNGVIVVEDYLNKYNLKWSFFKNNENKGQLVSKNFAAQKARGKYLIFMDSDDYFPDEYTCQRMYNIIQGNRNQTLFMFRCVGINGKEVTNSPDFNGVLSFRDYFKKKVNGEYLPVVYLEAFNKVKFRPDLRSGTGLAWRKITEYNGSLYISSVLSRIYDNSHDQRLTNRNKDYYKRYLKYRTVDLQMNLMNYLKYDQKGGLKLVKNIFKIRFKLLRYVFSSQTS